MTTRIALFVLTTGSVLLAQDKVNVPLSSPGQPVIIKASVLSGNITVTAGTGNEVTVQTSSTPSRRAERNTPVGMRRIGGGTGDIDIEEDHNTVTIRTSRMGGGGADLVITAPVNTSVQLRATNSDHIDVTGLAGDQEVDMTNGSINLKSISGSVVAHSLNGHVMVDMARVTTGKPMSFTSLNGRIDVTLPSDTRARLRLKTDNGSAYSDFDVKMETDASKPVLENSSAGKGKYKIRMDRSLYGSINGGGPEFLFQTMNGDILIHKK
jgi:DUF4097 and DUF4098 domain-containing protein YvlB